MADVAIGLGSFTETDIASATTCDIGAATTLRVHITGTTTITSFGLSTNRIRFLRFSGILTLTHNAISLILPSGANIVTAAGDTAMAVSGPSGGWRVTDYTRADGTPLVALALDSDLNAIAALTPSNDDIIQRKAGAWTNRTIAQIASDLGLAANYQPLDSDLTALAALTTTSFGRSLLEAANAGALRTLAGAVIGTDVEAHDADLTTIAGLSPSNDDILQRKAGAWANRTIAQLLTDLGLGALYQPLDSDLTSIAALTTTSFGRSLLALADEQALRDQFNGWKVLAHDATQHQLTGTITETTVLTVAVPANAMGPNGLLRVTLVGSATNSAGIKTFVARFNTTSIYYTTNLTTQLTFRSQFQIANRNSASSQVGMPASFFGFGTGSNALVTSAHDTTTSKNLTFTLTIPGAGDNAAIEAYTVEVFHGA